MTTYGYRLFDVQLRRERKQTDLPFVQSDSSGTFRYRDHFEQLLSDHLLQRKAGKPRPQADDLDDDAVDEADRPPSDDPVFSVVAVGRRGAHVTFEVRYGRNSGYDLAQAGPDEDDEDLPIERRRVTRCYRGVLVLPDAGTHGVLALETIGRACPVEPVKSWVKQWSREASLDGPMPADGKRPAWWTLRAQSLADDDRRAEFARQAAAQKVTLMRRSLNAAGSPDSADVTLEVNLKHHARWRRAADAEKRRWYDAFRQKQPVTPSAAAASLAAIFGGAGDGFDYDEASMQLDDGTASKRVTPIHFPDVFTYPIVDDVAPDSGQLYARVRGSIEKVSRVASLPSFDWTSWPNGR